VSLLVNLEAEGCPEHLKWSANGQRIGFTVSGRFGGGHGYVVDVPSNQLNPLALDEVFSTCKWSPDGNWLSCANTRSTVVLNLTSGRRFDLSTADSLGLPTYRMKPEWSSNGRWLAFSTSKGIYVFDSATHQTVRIADQEGGFAWSPPCE
ncbi:MAG: hypothetical protein PVF45_04250, partial [Anaerolineae bacterium]|jgi:hypothetical protein